MPELPEVEAARRLIAPAMRGARFERVQLRRLNLRRAFPPDFAARLTGALVDDVTRRAKYLLLPLSSGDTLLMHLGMSGSFAVTRREFTLPSSVPPVLHSSRPRPVLLHDHVVFEMSSGFVVTFTDPRRFGVMDLLDAEALATDPTLVGLGPEPLSETFAAGVLARACARRAVSLKVALLDQRVVAGLGNIYAAEALHLARLSPFRKASTIATATGKPRPTAERLAAAIRTVLVKAVDHESRQPYRSARFRVYDREGGRCPTRGCPGVIRRAVQAGRSTFYCATCQR